MFDHLRCLQDRNQEIQDVLGQNFGVPDDIDEDELMGELDALEDDMATELDAGPGGVPSYMQVGALATSISASFEAGVAGAHRGRRRARGGCRPHAGGFVLCSWRAGCWMLASGTLGCRGLQSWMQNLAGCPCTCQSDLSVPLASQQAAPGSDGGSAAVGRCFCPSSCEHDLGGI